MAILTYQKIQDRIHVLYENEVNTPSITDEDWQIRESLINQAISEWEQHEGVLWNELVDSFTLTTNGSDELDLPGDFLYLMGKVRVDGAEYELIRPEQAQDKASTDQCVYVIGRPGSRKLKFTVTPEAGVSVTGDYYHQATEVDSNNLDAVPEVSNPQYLINWVLAELHAADNNITGYNKAKQDANSILAMMVLRNAMNAHGQENKLPDLLNIGFGV